MMRRGRSRERRVRESFSHPSSERSRALGAGPAACIACCRRSVGLSSFLFGTLIAREVLLAVSREGAREERAAGGVAAVPDRILSVHRDGD